MTRHQTGSLYKAYGSYHLKYYASVMRDGKTVRAQRSHKLCSLSKPKKLAKELATEFISKINAADKRVVAGQDMLIAEFFENRFTDYCKELVPIKKRVRYAPKTIADDKQVWRQFLRDHFGSMTLQEYDVERGNDFLESLKDTKSGRQILGVRKLARKIFKLAVKDKRIKANPWRDVVMPDDVSDSGDTQAYTLEEAEDIITALFGHPDCQLIMALACFEGLRPGEIAALKWIDVDANLDWVGIRRSVVNGIVGPTKTESSVGDVPLVHVVPELFKQWKPVCPESKDGWVFPSRNDTPIDLHNLAARVLKPHVEGGNCVRCDKDVTGTAHKWKTLYAGRRCAATLAISLSGGNYQIAQKLLRHASLKTTLDVYDKGLTRDQMRTLMLEAYSPKQLISS